MNESVSKEQLQTLVKILEATPNIWATINEEGYYLLRYGYDSDHKDHPDKHWDHE